MINVLWLTSDKLGCGTYRCYMPALSLQDAKVTDNSFLFHDQCTDMDKIKEELDGIDVVVFQRAVGTLFIDAMKYCKTQGIATVFEMDDNLFDVPRHNPAAWFWRRKAVQRMLRQQIELVDRVIVSTKPLRATVLAAMGWGSDETKIRVCMNHLHPAVWGKAVWGQVLPYHNQHLTIGWQGSTTHDTDFKQALPALRLLLNENPNLLLRFLGCVPLSVKGIIPEDRFQWTRGVQMEMYPSTLRFVNFDIGIAPVTDSEFNRSKSNIKWLEYSALAIPSVCSRVYPYERSITDGENGFLASTADEWYAKLNPLVQSAELRKRIGAQAQAHVWREWSYETFGPRWADALVSVAKPRATLDQLITGEVPCASFPTPAVNPNPPTS